MVTRFRKLLLLTFAAGVCFFYAKASFAQEAELPKSVQVSPVRYDWVLQNGEERIARVNLKNYATVPYKVEVQVEDFQVSDNSSEAQFFVPDNQHPFKAYDVINWISTPEMNLVLDGGESRDIFFTIKVPTDVPTGGYYGAIFFQYEPQNPNTEDDGTGNAKVKIHTRAGVLLTMSVKGEGPITENGVLKSLKALKKVFWQGPVQLNAVFENTGNIPFKTFGTMEIYRGSKKFYSSDIETRLNYPGRFRNYELSWQPDLLDIGLFNVKIHFLSEDEHVVADSETSLWLIPWKIIASGLGVLLVLFLVFYAGRAGGKRK